MGKVDLGTIQYLISHIVRHTRKAIGGVGIHDQTDDDVELIDDPSVHVTMFMQYMSSTTIAR